jgi:hypothetical protein
MPSSPPLLIHQTASPLSSRLISQRAYVGGQANIAPRSPPLSYWIYRDYAFHMAVRAGSAVVGTGRVGLGGSGYRGHAGYGAACIYGNVPWLSCFKVISIRPGSRMVLRAVERFHGQCDLDLRGYEWGLSRGVQGSHARSNRPGTVRHRGSATLLTFSIRADSRGTGRDGAVLYSDTKSTVCIVFACAEHVVLAQAPLTCDS